MSFFRALPFSPAPSADDFRRVVLTSAIPPSSSSSLDSSKYPSPTVFRASSNASPMSSICDCTGSSSSESAPFGSTAFLPFVLPFRSALDSRINSASSSSSSAPASFFRAFSPCFASFHSSSSSSSSSGKTTSSPSSSSSSGSASGKTTSSGLKSSGTSTPSPPSSMRSRSLSSLTHARTSLVFDRTLTLFMTHSCGLYGYILRVHSLYSPMSR